VHARAVQEALPARHKRAARRIHPLRRQLAPQPPLSWLPHKAESLEARELLGREGPPADTWGRACPPSLAVHPREERGRQSRGRAPRRHVAMAMLLLKAQQLPIVLLPLGDKRVVPKVEPEPRQQRAALRRQPLRAVHPLLLVYPSRQPAPGPAVRALRHVAVPVRFAEARQLLKLPAPARALRLPARARGGGGVPSRGSGFQLLARVVVPVARCVLPLLAALPAREATPREPALAALPTRRAEGRGRGRGRGRGCGRTPCRVLARPQPDQHQRGRAGRTSPHAGAELGAVFVLGVERWKGLRVRGPGGREGRARANGERRLGAAGGARGEDRRAAEAGGPQRQKGQGGQAGGRALGRCVPATSPALRERARSEGAASVRAPACVLRGSSFCNLELLLRPLLRRG